MEGSLIQINCLTEKGSLRPERGANQIQGETSKAERDHWKQVATDLRSQRWGGLQSGVFFPGPALEGQSSHVLSRKVPSENLMR